MALIKKVFFIIIIGVIGLALQQLYAEHIVHVKLMDLGVQFIGAEVVKSALLLLFSKNFHKLD
jgi:hypothetical protein